MMSRIQIFSCPMDASTMSETVHAIGDRIERREFTQHVVVNVAKLVNMQTDRMLADSIRACDLINIDGMGVVWAARVLGHDVPERVAGIDLFFALAAMAAERRYPVYLLGATAEVVEKTTQKLRSQFPKLEICGYQHGYFWDDEVGAVEKIRRSGARLLFVAITSPKKEQFINEWKSRLGVDFVMGVGGSFDVVAGKVRRAPRWMQRVGLEWFYRVIQEPGRMWRRYFRTNLIFVSMLVREYVSAKGI